MAKQHINYVFIQRLVNRRAAVEEEASLIWKPKNGETDANFQARREAWFTLLFDKPKKELVDDIPAGDGVQYHEGADEDTYYGDLRDAIKNCTKEDTGTFLVAYQRIRLLIQQIIAHEIEDFNVHLVAQADKAYRAGYQKGHDDHTLGVFNPDAGWDGYKDSVEKYGEDATLHHTY